MKLLIYCFFVISAFAMNVAAQDVHSYANPSAVRVRHVDLDWDVLFDQKILKGAATLSIERTSQTDPLIVDTRDLKIEKVEMSVDGRKYAPATFELGTSDKILGAPLTIPLPLNRRRFTRAVGFRYRTRRPFA
jgi:aminopeptidase N